jgi:Domain of unknown function (DUF4275)
MESISAKYLAAIESTGGLAEVVPDRARWKLLQDWRQVYAATQHSVTGKWTYRGFGWHAFSFGYARALHGERADLAYKALAPPHRLIVCPQDAVLTAFQVIGGSLPDFRPTRRDIYVWPDGLGWTMAFTHEDGNSGPYFSRREWMMEFPLPGGK